MRRSNNYAAHHLCAIQNQGATLLAVFAGDMGCAPVCSGEPLGPPLEHEHQRRTQAALSAPPSGYLPPLGTGPSCALQWDPCVVEDVQLRHSVCSLPWSPVTPRGPLAPATAHGNGGQAPGGGE